MPRKQSLRSVLQNIKLLLLDVDGVMTDGGIYYSNSGDEFKKFNIHDGYGIVKLQRAGIKVGIITGRRIKDCGKTGRRIRDHRSYQISKIKWKRTNL